MKLGEYYVLRCGNKKFIGLSLTSKEIRNYRILDYKSGWANRSKDLEVPDEIILKTCRELIAEDKIKANIKVRLVLLVQRLESIGVDSSSLNTKTFGEEYLYIMKNEIEMFKIGVSKTPLIRARNLTNSSGLKCELIGYYAGAVLPRDVEKHILHKFSRYRAEGEWFKPNTITKEEIESEFPSSYIKLGE